MKGNAVREQRCQGITKPGHQCEIWGEGTRLDPFCCHHHTANRMTMTETTKEKLMNETTRPVLVTTKHRGVFAGKTGTATAATDQSIRLTGAKMAIHWGTTRGVNELADTGPTTKSRISAPADVELVDITAVFEITDTAWEKWEAS